MLLAYVFLHIANYLLYRNGKVCDQNTFDVTRKASYSIASMRMTHGQFYKSHLEVMLWPTPQKTHHEVIQKNYGRTTSSEATAMVKLNISGTPKLSKNTEIEEKHRKAKETAHKRAVKTGTNARNLMEWNLELAGPTLSLKI
jgi:hypothetical protein